MLILGKKLLQNTEDIIISMVKLTQYLGSKLVIMKIGDLVIRKVSGPHCRSFKNLSAIKQREELGHGIILSKQMAGSNPVHPCITVLYPKTGAIYDIAESLMEVISESR